MPQHLERHWSVIVGNMIGVGAGAWHWRRTPLSHLVFPTSWHAELTKATFQGHATHTIYLLGLDSASAKSKSIADRLSRFQLPWDNVKVLMASPRRRCSRSRPYLFWPCFDSEICLLLHYEDVLVQDGISMLSLVAPWLIYCLKLNIHDALSWERSVPENTWRSISYHI